MHQRVSSDVLAFLTPSTPPVAKWIGTPLTNLWEIYARVSREAASRVTTAIGSTAFHDLERGFRSEELEILPEEMDTMPEFEEHEYPAAAGRAQ